MVCGFLVVIALSVAAFFAQKTRGKIWRHGKPNIYWEEPLVGGKTSEGRDVEEWVRGGGGGGGGGGGASFMRICREKSHVSLT